MLHGVLKLGSPKVRFLEAKGAKRVSDMNGLTAEWTEVNGIEMNG